MRSDRVVVLAPLRDDDLCFLEAVEDFTVEQFVAQLAVEAFAVAVLPGASWRDVQRLGSDVRQPLAHDLGRHLGAIVRSDVLGNAVHDHGVGHCLDDAHAVDPPCNTDRQAFPRELVDQRHQPDFPAIVGLGFDEVVRPDVIAPLRSQPDAASVIEP